MGDRIMNLVLNRENIHTKENKARVPRSNDQSKWLTDLIDRSH